MNFAMLRDDKNISTMRKERGYTFFARNIDFFFFFTEREVLDVESMGLEREEIPTERLL